jgi:plastocyanin
MGRLLGVTLAAGIALVAAPGAWAQGSEPIIVEDDEFSERVEGAVAASDGFTWLWSLGVVNEHNVLQDDRLFRSGNPKTTGSFDLPGISAGTFPYHCEVHGNGVMDGVLRVFPDLSFNTPTGGPVTIDVEWALEDAPPTGDQFDVMYRIEDGRWKHWKRNTARGSAVFGRNSQPATVRPNKGYAFKVRSELERNPSRASKFSPPVAIAFSP